MLRRLGKIPKGVRKAVRAELERGAKDIVAAQKRFVRKRTGALEKSIHYTMGDVTVKGSASLASGKSAKGDPDLTATIVSSGGNKGWYARFIEFGTKAHSLAKGAVVARRGRRAKKQGQGLQHPGSRPFPFFFAPYRAMRQRIRRRVSAAMKKAILASKG